MISPRGLRSGISYKRTLSHLLDRPGGRWLLGKVATPYARRVLGADVEIVHINGLWTHRVESSFFPDGPTFACVSLGSWKTQLKGYVSDTKEYWLKHYRPQEGDVIIDVGAGRGEDALTFSREVGETGRVIAIEASPRSFAILKNFCLLNKLTNVTVLQIALMDKSGLVRIVEDESSWIQDSIEFGASTAIGVPAATLDEICEQEGLKDIAFLKMNIEGAERYALLGMESVLPYTHQICVACHDFRSDAGDGEQFRTRAFVEQFLVNQGFSITSSPDDPREYVRDHVFGLRRS
jgi:FkbM family methyltransferase